MACALGLFPEHRLLIFRVNGSLELPDLFDAMHACLAAIGPGVRYREYIDLSRADFPDFGFQEMLQVAGRKASVLESGVLMPHMVFHAPADTQYGMARMFEQLLAASADAQVTLCRSRQEARAALGLPPLDLVIEGYLAGDGVLPGLDCEAAANGAALR